MLRVLSTPVIYALELTSNCDNRCSGCLTSARIAKQTAHNAGLDAANWRTVLTRIAPHAQRLKITGGEPTLHPEFDSILKDVDQLGIDFVLFTNGRWTDPERVISLLADTRSLTGLLISLHGAQAASHEAFTGVTGSFEQTVANIQYAVAQSLPVTLSTVLTRLSTPEMEAIVDLAQRLGAHHVVFNRYLGHPTRELELAPAELAEAVRRVDAMADQGRSVKFGNCIPQCFLSNTSTGCLAGVAYCAVDPWGYLKACTHTSQVAGSLLEHPLSDLWYSPTMETFRSSIPVVCHRCRAFSMCHGGCRAEALRAETVFDPLACPSAPIDTAQNITLSLNPDACPVGHFKILSEAWGIVLIRGNRVVSLDTDALQLLSMLGGHSTLADIENQLGSPAISLIGRLHQQHMISFI